MDRDALVARCEARFRDESNHIVSAAQWASYIDECYAEVAQTTPLWPWTEGWSTSVTISSGNSATLPSDVFSVFSVWNETDNFLLMALTGRSGHIRRYDDDNETGIPEAYRLFGGSIYVYPTPEVSTVLHVEYPVFAVLAGGSSEPAFSEVFHPLLIDGALAKAYQDDGNTNWEQRHRTLFNEAIAKMLNYYLTQVGGDSYPEISDTFYDHSLGGI